MEYNIGDIYVSNRHTHWQSVEVIDSTGAFKVVESLDNTDINYVSLYTRISHLSLHWTKSETTKVTNIMKRYES